LSHSLPSPSAAASRGAGSTGVGHVPSRIGASGPSITTPATYPGAASRAARRLR